MLEFSFSSCYTQREACVLNRVIGNKKQTNNRIDPIPKTLHKQESITGLFIEYEIATGIFVVAHSTSFSIYLTMNFKN